jgi:hypothetical protein
LVPAYSSLHISTNNHISLTHHQQTIPAAHARTRRREQTVRTCITYRWCRRDLTGDVKRACARTEKGQRVPHCYRQAPCMHGHVAARARVRTSGHGPPGTYVRARCAARSTANHRCVPLLPVRSTRTAVIPDSTDAGTRSSPHGSAPCPQSAPVTLPAPLPSLNHFATPVSGAF